jgi:hypothetical protein
MLPYPAASSVALAFQEGSPSIPAVANDRGSTSLVAGLESLGRSQAALPFAFGYRRGLSSPGLSPHSGRYVPKKRCLETALLLLLSNNFLGT